MAYNFPSLLHSQNTSDMHTFTAIHGILKMRVTIQNKKVGTSRNFAEKVGNIGQTPKSRKSRVA